MTKLLLNRLPIRIAAAFFAVTLLVQSLAAFSSAAEETVTSISLEGVTTPIQLYVEDGTVNLTLWAAIQGSSTPRNVTSEAVWTSSSSSIKVERGVLSATGSAASATVTAKYKTFTAAATVRADYRYASVKLENTNGSDAPEQLGIELGNMLDLKASAYEDDGGKLQVTDTAQWLSSNAAVATVSGGQVTLVGPGTVTITARLKGRSDAIQLAVTSPYESLGIEHAAPGDSIEMNVGDAPASLKAVAVPKNDALPDQDVTADATWTSSNQNVLKVDKGVITPLAAGAAVVTAKRFGVQDAITVYVRTPFEGMKLESAKPLSTTLYGTSVEVTATVFKGTAAPVNVSLDAEWTISDPLVAGIEKTGGKVWVKPKGVGTAKLTVKYKGLTEEEQVWVFPSINTVDISKERLDLFEGDDGTLPAVKGVTVSGDEIDISRLVQWKSSDSSVLAIEDGQWTAKKTGTVTLTAEVENEPESPKKSDSIEVTIHKDLLVLNADTAFVSVVTGKEVNLPKVTLIYADGEEKDVSSEIVWKSSSPNLFVKPGKMKGLLPASVTLTGTYLNKKVTVKVQVEEAFTSFEIEPKTVHLTLGKTVSVKVIGKTKSGKKITLGSRISWESDKEDVVLIKGASVKGLAEGSGKLTATVQDKKLELPFTVTAKLTKLSFSEKSLTAKPGDTDTLKLTAAYENGKTLDVTAAAGWSSSSSKVATVSGGVIKAVGKGSATIKAVYGGKSLTIRITVK